MLHVLKPVKFAADMLISTNAVETVPTWIAGTYADGALVYWLHPTTGLPRIWESLVNTNTVQPGTDANKWLDLRASNTHAMFDDRVASQTTRTGNLVVLLEPHSAFTTVGLLNLKGNSVTLEVLDAGLVVHTQVIDLRRTTVVDWYTYFTAPFEFLSRAVFYNVPAYFNSRIRITVSGTNTAIGHLVFGPLVEIGHVKYGASSGIIDYSVKRKDETYGDSVFVERDFADENTFPVSVKKSRTNLIKTTLRDLRATPCLWIGSDDPEYAESLITFGWYRTHTLVAQYFDESILDIEIEGLT